MSGQSDERNANTFITGTKLEGKQKPKKKRKSSSSDSSSSSSSGGKPTGNSLDQAIAAVAMLNQNKSVAKPET